MLPDNLTPDKKMVRWEIVSLAKEIFVSECIIEHYDKDTGTWVYGGDDKRTAEMAKASIHAAEIFYEELAKHSGAT